MSYEKAMKHSIRKSRKQGNNHFGFDTGTGSFKETTAQRKYVVLCMDITRWFCDRHEGDSQHTRECIRESIVELRELRKQLYSKSEAA